MLTINNTQKRSICCGQSPEGCFPNDDHLDDIPTELLYDNLDVLLPTLTNINTSMAPRAKLGT